MFDYSKTDCYISKFVFFLIFPYRNMFDVYLISPFCNLSTEAGLIDVEIAYVHVYLAKTFTMLTGASYQLYMIQVSSDISPRRTAFT